MEVYLKLCCNYCSKSPANESFNVRIFLLFSCIFSQCSPWPDKAYVSTNQGASPSFSSTPLSTYTASSVPDRYECVYPVNWVVGWPHLLLIISCCSDSSSPNHQADPGNLGTSEVSLLSWAINLQIETRRVLTPVSLSYSTATEPHSLHTGYTKVAAEKPFQLLRTTLF